MDRLALTICSCVLAANFNVLADGVDPPTRTDTGVSYTTGQFINVNPQAPHLPGPYAVGRSTFAYVDFARDNRLVIMDAWYPVDPASLTDEPVSFYDLVFTSLDSPTAYLEPPVSARAPFPMIVFSHGSLGTRFQSFFLTEALASHGFFVVAPDHAGNTAQDLVFDTLAPFEDVVIDRPLDITFTIDKMLERNETGDDLFFGAIDAERIGAIGHSFGGYTVLAVASGIPEVALDPRVDAIAPVAPATTILPVDLLSNITIPTLILGGSADITTPVDPQSAVAFDGIAAVNKLRVDIQEAGHQSFTNICVFTEVLLDVGIDPDFIAFLLGNADEGCVPELIPIAEAHEITNLYLVSFMKTFVAGRPEYDRYLDPEFASRRALPVVIIEP